MIRYIHGSQDSTDLDVVYVFDSLPKEEDCIAFCSEEPTENRNIIVIQDGQVIQCFKGAVDEVNNALITTYPLHEQEYPLLLVHPIERDILLKELSVVRKILMLGRHTQWHKESKAALKGSWGTKLEVLRMIRLTEAVWVHCDPIEERKRLAFQLGQVLALLEGRELYTKSEITNFLPVLYPYLYRQDVSGDPLQTVLNTFVSQIEQLDIRDVSPHMIEYRGSGQVRRFDLQCKERELL